MKFERLLVLFFALVLSIGSAYAVAPGKTLEWAGGGAGKVTLDGKVHADKGLKCPDCHTNPKLFAMKKGTEKMSMKDMNAGKGCGTCHNGKKAFATKDAATCGKCHKK
ncbi:MAG: cytochrome C [Betaproteobacteria bacterium]|nr:cytochrome C [Betaproteobacteria bacterium]